MSYNPQISFCLNRRLNMVRDQGSEVQILSPQHLILCLNLCSHRIPVPSLLVRTRQLAGESERFIEALQQQLLSVEQQGFLYRC
jgi:hypothetical protein